MRRRLIAALAIAAAVAVLAEHPGLAQQGQLPLPPGGFKPPPPPPIKPYQTVPVTPPPTTNPTPSACEVPCHHPWATASDRYKLTIPATTKPRPETQV